MSTSSRLTREDWIVAAFEVLDEKGVHGLKVGPLAKSLGVTKGSFYWHFDSRRALLRAMLDYWSKSLVDRIDAEVALHPDNPVDELMWILRRIASGELNEHDPAIRVWAVFDPMAADAVQQVDADRLEYKRDLFRRMGFDEAQAELRSRLSYYYIVGEQVVALDQSPEARLAHVEARHAILTALP
jgi:AcrR family transcriptional regulator